MSLKAIADALPDFAKDIRLNLGSLLNDQTLGDQRKYGLLLACAHGSGYKPVVDAADRVYEVVVPQPGEGTTVVVDGRPLWTLAASDRVRIERAAPRFKLLECGGRTYYRTLRDKLGWAGNLYRK